MAKIHAMNEVTADKKTIQLLGLINVLILFTQLLVRGATNIT